MKKTFLLTISLLVSYIAFSQNSHSGCSVNIQVLNDRYMQATAHTSDDDLKKVKVIFNENLVSVYVPQAEGSILLNIENSNCEAYCSKAKRVRQLNKGDEKLLRNLIDREMLSIVSQAKACK